jgi:hypothetical protein
LYLGDDAGDSSEFPFEMERRVSDHNGRGVRASQTFLDGGLSILLLIYIQTLDAGGFGVNVVVSVSAADKSDWARSLD